MSSESFTERIAAVERLLPSAMVRERLSARGRLGRLRRSGAADAAACRELERIESLLARSAERRSRRIEGVPATDAPEHLPINARRDEIIAAVRRHPVVVVAGDTGSGKSTQLPKFCLAAGRGTAGLIGHTQPRRIAAQSVARRIAEELGEPIGRSVGYKIRFQDVVSEAAYIKVMTDGILLAEAVRDRRLSAYDTLIVDEAHERSLNIDFILGYLRMLLRRRRDLRVVITSATIDTDKFAAAFGGAPVIEVSGRVYPVDVRYAPPDEGPDEATAVEQAAAAVRRLFRERRPGATLVFMPTEQDIRETVEAVSADAPPGTQVLPLFARLTAAEQGRVFRPAPPGVNRVIVATNVAETSVTLPGIRTVVDTGLARIPRYSPRTRTTAMPVVPISRSSADQRKGRCGRTAEGLCIRLYAEEDYLARPEYTPPEILRANLAEVILRMLALDLGDPAEFPFIDPPDRRSLADGFRLLTELGALAERSGEAGTGEAREPAAPRARLTETGSVMARIPLDPRLSRMLIEARREGCLREMTVIAAALSLPDPRERPAERTAEADRAHAVFHQPHSDFLTLLTIWDRWQDAKSGPGGGTAAARRFCRRHFLSFKRMREWEDIHRQITEVLAECTPAARPGAAIASTPDYGAVHRSVLSGFLANIAAKKEKNLYRAARDREAMIFPGSGLFNTAGPWVVAAEMVETSRLFARTVATIDPQWLEPLAGGLCRSAFRDARWDAKRGEVVATEQVTLFGLIIVPGRTIAYGRVRPEEAAEIFVRDALVGGGIGRPFPFLTHNRQVIARVESMEDRLRRRDLRVSDEDLVEFYRRRLPGVFDVRTLAHLVKTRGDAFLRMSESDVTAVRPDAAELARFPRTLKAGRQALPLDYRFEPGSTADGVTLRVPLALAPAVPPQSIEWLVPGLLREKVEVLLKALPKAIRRRLVPLNETVDTILREMPQGSGAFLTALGEFIHRRFGVDIPAAAWSAGDLPDHLRMRVAVTAPDGREIAAGRSASILQSVPGGPAAIPDEAKRRWERRGLTRWDVGDLPEAVGSGPGEAVRWAAYPALTPAGAAVDLVLCAAPAAAAAAHPGGVAALTALHLARDLKFLKRSIALPEELHAAARAFGGARRVEDQMVERLVHDLFRADVRTQAAFEAHAAACASRLVPAGRELLYAVMPVLAAHAQVRRDLEPLARARGVSGVHAALAEELAELVPPGFIALYDRQRLVHLERYLRALSLRARRAAEDPERDRAKSGGPGAYADRVKAMAAALGPKASPEKRAALEELFWMVAEYKVSVFAQELKTAGPVSPKRLDDKIRAIERMA